jgi:hypothetical protein
METKGFKVPGWFIGVIAALGLIIGGSSQIITWAYANFVPRIERDFARSLNDKRWEEQSQSTKDLQIHQEQTEEKLDRLEGKIDLLLQRTKK